MDIWGEVLGLVVDYLGLHWSRRALRRCCKLFQSQFPRIVVSPREFGEIVASRSADLDLIRIDWNGELGHSWRSLHSLGLSRRVRVGLARDISDSAVRGLCQLELFRLREDFLCSGDEFGLSRLPRSEFSGPPDLEGMEDSIEQLHRYLAECRNEVDVYLLKAVARARLPRCMEYLKSVWNERGSGGPWMIPILTSGQFDFICDALAEREAMTEARFLLDTLVRIDEITDVVTMAQLLVVWKGPVQVVAKALREGFWDAARVLNQRGYFLADSDWGIVLGGPVGKNLELFKKHVLHVWGGENTCWKRQLVKDWFDGIVFSTTCCMEIKLFVIGLVDNGLERAWRFVCSALLKSSSRLVDHVVLIEWILEQKPSLATHCGVCSSIGGYVWNPRECKASEERQVETCWWSASLVDSGELVARARAKTALRCARLRYAKTGLKGFLSRGNYATSRDMAHDALNLQLALIVDLEKESQLVSIVLGSEAYLNISHLFSRAHRSSLAPASRLWNLCAVLLTLSDTFAHGGDIDAHGPDGFAPIHWAAFSQNITLMKFLVAKGANVNTISAGNGFTPLMLAVIGTLYSDRELESCDIVEFLLENKADVNARDAEGRTALFHSVLVNAELCAPFLVSFGADPTIPDLRGTSPIDLVSYLHQCGPQLTFQGYPGTDWEYYNVRDFLTVRDTARWVERLSNKRSRQTGSHSVSNTFESVASFAEQYGFRLED